MTALVRKRVRRYALELRAIRNRYLDSYVFIHINKTGGSSIEMALKLRAEHLTVQEKIKEIGVRRWQEKLSFTVVRNPWDKVVSHYHYRVQTNQTNLKTSKVAFKDWVRLTYGDKNPLYYDKPKLFMPQVNWLSDADGGIPVDHICRFEKLDEDFGAVCEKLGKIVHLPHLKSSKRTHYSDYYDEETREVVANWFRQDLEVFGYRFSDS